MKDPKWTAIVEMVVHAPDIDSVDDLIHAVVAAGDAEERVHTVWTKDIKPVHEET